MKTSQKGFISPLLLALIALLTLGGGAYVYIQNKQANQSAVVNTATQATSITQVQDNSGQILLGDRARYENLSSEEKRMVESYATAQKFGRTDYADCYLKYYDSLRALVGCATSKGVGLFLVNRKDWKDTVLGKYFSDLRGDELRHLISIGYKNAGYVESNKYVISVNNAEIFYYKVGDNNLTLVQGSRLPMPID